jgi:hypothetical protein
MIELKDGKKALAAISGLIPVARSRAKNPGQDETGAPATEACSARFRNLGIANFTSLGA